MFYLFAQKCFRNFNAKGKECGTNNEKAVAFHWDQEKKKRMNSFWYLVYKSNNVSFEWMSQRFFLRRSAFSTAILHWQSLHLQLTFFCDYTTLRFQTRSKITVHCKGNCQNFWAQTIFDIDWRLLIDICPIIWSYFVCLYSNNICT